MCFAHCYSMHFVSDSLYKWIMKDLLGIHSAREFVWWYNGHPDGRNLKPDLKNTDSAVVLGQVCSLIVLCYEARFKNSSGVVIVSEWAFA